ncbi:MAG: 5-formyltetrahydrofolate cyclo-ligase, partial [Pseudomonadales bacterium]
MSKKSRIAIRDSLRQSRRDMSRNEQENAAKKLFHLVGHEDFFRVANNIAFYLNVDGEINPKPLLDLALSEGKNCYLPVVTEANPEFISFAPYVAGMALEPNKWGIPEPPSNKILSPTEFDVVFVPLVGFSRQCFRLGMGKGFYDRTFSFKI